LTARAPPSFASGSVLLLNAELRTPLISDKLEQHCSYPGTQSAADSYGPVFSSKAVFADLESIAANLNDKYLTAHYTDPNDDEHPVAEESSEDIQIIVDDSAVYQVEDLHHSEHIEDIRHVSARAFVRLIPAPQ
jgi:hypothetical protein